MGSPATLFCLVDGHFRDDFSELIDGPDATHDHD
jgi:hypothetical protein